MTPAPQDFTSTLFSPKIQDRLVTFSVGLERSAGVPLVVHGFERGVSEQHELRVEHRDALRQRDATTIQPGGDQASCDLWRAGAGHPDLVESQVDVVLPGHRSYDESDLAVLAVNPTVGKRPPCKLPEDVVQPVYRLDRGRGVLEG